MRPERGSRPALRSLAVERGGITVTICPHWLAGGISPQVDHRIRGWVMQASAEQATEGQRNRSVMRRFRFMPQLLLLLAAASIARAAGPAVPVIITYAGFGSSTTGEDPLGDGGPATQAYLYLPSVNCVDALGNLYLTVSGRVRKVNTAGIISTAFALDPQQPDVTGTAISGVAVDAAGNLFVSDGEGNRIRKVSTSGAISIVAGSGSAGGFSGDGGPATQATLDSPAGLTFDRAGNLLVADHDNHRIRKINPAGTISTLVGNGSPEFSGDGGPALQAGLESVWSAATDSAGNLYLVDGERVRKVDATGRITTFAGGGAFEYDAVATHISLARLSGIALDAADNVYVANSWFVRMIRPQGTVRHVAGVHGIGPGYNGDGGPAEQARLSFTSGIAVDAQGNQFVGDRTNLRIRKIAPQPAMPVLKGLDAFRPYEVSALAGWPADIMVGDVNGDRRSDVVTTTSSDPNQADPANDFKLRVQLQLADGTLAAPLVFAYPAGSANAGGHLALADFNRDGVMDVAVGHAAGVSVMAGSRTSSFLLKPFYTGIAIPADEAMTVDDLDRDGNMDVVSVHTDLVESTLYPRLTIAYGNGLGTTSRQSSVPVAYASARRIAVAEVNRDAWPDVIDANSWHVDVAMSDAHGGLLPAQPAAYESTDGLSVGDINGDNRSDVLASVLYGDDLMILPQGATGLATSPAYLRSYSLGGDTAVSDMDGDGRSDVVVAHGSGAVSLILQTPTGLQQAVKFPLPRNDVGASSGPMATGDVNGDGCRDVVLPLLDIGLVTLKGQHCRISVGGSDPRLPRSPGPMVSSGASEAVAQAGKPMVDARDGRGRGWRLRDLAARINLLPRMLAWLVAQYADLSRKPVPAAADAVPRDSSATAEPRRSTWPLIVGTTRDDAPTLRVVPVLRGSDTVCMR